LVGAKLGLTSRAKQKVMSVDNPLYGWVTSDMLFPAEDPVPLDRFIHPRVESEIAFLLGRDVETRHGDQRARRNRGCVRRRRHPRLAVRELPVQAAGRRRGQRQCWRLHPRPTVLAPTQVPDLRLVGCVVRVDGEVVATAAGAAVMGHPAAWVAWLANKLAASKRHLQAGWLVFSGGLTEPFPLGPTGSVSFEFDGLCSIEVRGA
jgi:2-oxo-3-hexenedioate decarboxylase